MAQDAIHVRLDEISRRLAELERVEPAVVAGQVRELRRELAEFKDEVREDLKEAKEDNKATRRSLYAVTISVMTAAIIFAFSAFQIAGHP